MTYRKRMAAEIRAMPELYSGDESGRQASATRLFSDRTLYSLEYIFACSAFAPSYVKVRRERDSNGDPLPLTCATLGRALRYYEEDSVGPDFVSARGPAQFIDAVYPDLLSLGFIRLVPGASRKEKPFEAAEKLAAFLLRNGRDAFALWTQSLIDEAGHAGEPA